MKKAFPWLLLLLAIAYIIFMHVKSPAPCQSERDTTIIFLPDTSMRQVEGEITLNRELTEQKQENSAEEKSSITAVPGTVAKGNSAFYDIHIQDDRLNALAKLEIINGIPESFRMDYQLTGADSIRLTLPFKNPLSDKSGLYAGAFATSQLQVGPLLQYHNIRGFDILAGYSLTDKAIMVGYTHRISLKNIFR